MITIPPGLNFPNVTDAQCNSVENLSGNGPPPNELGDPGATYVDLLVDAFYWKSTSGWQPGLPPIPDDVKPFHGIGAPAPDFGNPGDTYVDDNTSAFYFKGATGWKTFP